MKTSLLLSLALSTFTLSANASIVPDGYDPYFDINQLTYEVDQSNYSCEQVASFEYEKEVAQNIVDIKANHTYKKFFPEKVEFEEFEMPILNDARNFALYFLDDNYCDFLKVYDQNYFSYNRFQLPQTDYPNQLASYAYLALKAHQSINSNINVMHSSIQDKLIIPSNYFIDSGVPTVDIDQVISRVTGSLNYRAIKAGENMNLVTIPAGLETAENNLYYLAIKLSVMLDRVNHFPFYDETALNLALEKVMADLEKTSYLINGIAIDDAMSEYGLLLSLNKIKIGLNNEFKYQWLAKFDSFAENTTFHMSQKNLQRQIINHAKYLNETYGTDAKYKDYVLYLVNQIPQ